MIQEDDLEATRRRLANAMRVGQVENPDALAADRRQAEALGVSVGALRVARQQGVTFPAPDLDLDDVIANAPATAGFLSEPDNAAVAHDSVRELTLLERNLFTPGDLGRQFLGGAVGTVGTIIRGIGRFGANAAANGSPVGTASMRQLFSSVAPGAMEAVATAGKRIESGGRNISGDLTPQERTGRTTLGQMPLPERRVDTGFGGDVAAGLGQLASQALFLLATGGTGATFLIGAQGVGAMDARVDQAREREGRVGEEYTTEENVALVGAGAVTSLTERLGLNAVLGRLPGPLRDRIQSRLGQVIVAGGTEGLTEVAETIGSNALALYLLDENTTLLDGTIEAGSVGAAVGSIANAIVQSAVPGRQQALNAERGQADADRVRQLFDQSAENPLRARSPEAFEDFVRQAADGTDLTDLYISAEALNQSGVDLNALRAAVPAVDEQLDNALATSGDVRIPVEQAAARIAGTDFSEPLLDHMRINPAMPSRAEASALGQEQAAALAADAERILQDATTTDAFRQSAQRVQDGLLAQLETAGRFTTDVNRSYASLVSNFYTTYASRLGITPEQMAERYPLRIQAELPTAARPETLDQGDTQVQPETVRLIHFSRAENLTVTDPSRWGASSATPAGERARVASAPGRTYFYDAAVRTRPEAAVGQRSPIQYGAEIERSALYDFDADPAGLRPTEGEDAASAYETAIRDAGFRGYFSNAVVPGAVAVFDPIPLRAEGLIRTIRQAQAVDRRAAELQREERMARVAVAGPDEITTAKPLVEFRAVALAEVFAETEQPIEGAPKSTKMGDQRIQIRPYAPARQAAADYMASRGLRYEPPTSYAKVDVARAGQIAEAFDLMAHAPNDPLVRAAYSAMIEETLAQYQFIKATGLEIEFITGDDPYAASPRMAIQDVVENNHLWVFPTDTGFGGAASVDVDITGNPLLAPVNEWVGDRQLLANDVFRIVHDYFGHIKDGFGFRADGEENAWQSHAAMYSPLARRAMTAETRGQNSWVNFGPFADFNKTANAAETEYAPQKVGLLPEWASTDGFLGGANSGLPVGQDAPQALDQGPAPQPAADTISKLQDTVPGIAGVAPYLTSEERARLKKASATKLVAFVQSLPSADEMASVAWAGRAKRGWYERSANALVEIFGAQDATRFAALLAALSPQTSVESNTFNALATWVNWNAAGRPTDRKSIIDVMGESVEGDKGTASILDAWINNAVRALASDSPTDLDLSGAKVNSFFANLVGAVDEVTNDAWMGAYAAIPASKLRGPESEDQFGRVERKGIGYIAMNAVVRRAAEVLSQRTGETWTPAEVQETVWSWAKTLYEKRDRADATTEQILEMGGLRHEDIATTPDFALLFTNGVFRRILEAGGYGQELEVVAAREQGGRRAVPEGNAADAEGAGVAEDVFSTDLQSAARRLEQVRNDRLARAAEKRGKAEPAEQFTLFQSEAPSNPPFYSALIRAVANTQTKSAPAAQWLATLRKTPGVKAEEIEWSGLEEWLALGTTTDEFEQVPFGQQARPLGDAKGNIKREDVLAFLQNGGVKVEEVVLGDGSATLQARIDARTEELLDEAIDRAVEQGGFTADHYVEEIEPEQEGETGGWRVVYPGYGQVGETYETEAEAQDAADEENLEMERSSIQSYRSDIYRDMERQAEQELGDDPSAARFPSYKLPGADDTYREILLTLPNIAGPSAHWHEPNVVAHARITTRTDASGAKVLFLEEVQSDWHQKGRDQGYAVPADPATAEAALDVWQAALDAETAAAATFVESVRAQLELDLAGTQEALDAAVNGSESYRANLATGVNELKTAITRLRSEIMGEDGNPVSAAGIAGNMFRRSREGGLMMRRPPEMVEAEAAFALTRLRRTEARVALDAASGTGGIPNAPFQKSWSTLVMKRMIRYAVDNGFDKVAWINGNQQNGGRTGGDGSFFYERNLVNTTNDLLKKMGGRVEQIDMRDAAIVDGERMAVEDAQTMLSNFDDADYQQGWLALGRDLEAGRLEMQRRLENAQSLVGRFNRSAGQLAVQNGFAITEQMRAQAAEGFALFQQNRGQIAFGQDITQTPSTISLLRTADLSTFLHETGHFFLEVTRDIAQREDAPAEIKADMQTLLSWFGVDSLEAWNALSFEERRQSHERFARGFEAYLMEGRAPTPALRGLFQTFRSWLLNVYKSMLSLNVELTDDVRGVMGRMLAAENEIADAKTYHGFTPMAEKPPYMDAATWADYQRNFAAATDDGVDALATRAVRDMRWLSGARSKKLRELQAQARDRRRQVKAEVTAEVLAEPVNRARAYLRRGLGPDGEPVPNPQKLDLASLRARYGEGPDALWRRLKIGGKFGEAGNDGVDPDVAAEMLGYDSGDALVRDLVEAEDANQKIAGMTDQRMLERYGGMADDTGIENAADEAIANDAHSRAIATDYAALATATGQPRALAAAAKTFAAGLVNRITLKQLKPNQFFAAMTRAGKAADKAAKANDLVTAATQRRNQLINLEAAKATIRAQAEVDKAMTVFKRIIAGKDEALSRSRDMALVNAARAVLSLYGIGRVKNDPTGYLERVKSNDPQLYADIQPFIDGARGLAQPLDQITFEQFQGLRDTVLQLWALSRRTRQIELDGQLVDIETAREALGARLDEIGVPVPQGQDQALTDAQKFGRYLQGARAALRRVESWVRAIDAADSGPFRRYIWNPVSTAADRYRVEQAEYLRRFLELVRPIEASLTRAKIAAPEIGYTFTGKSELLHAILHTGNTSNMSKLLLGRRWGKLNEDGSLDTSRWDAMLQRLWAEGTLTKADYDFAQGVWDLLDQTKIGAQRAHRDMYGRYFSEVTAEPIQTPFGEYRGGYVPATTDSFMVQDAQLRQEQEALEDSNAFMFPAASNGFTKARVEDYTRELSLDIRLLPMHIDKVLRFTHLGPPVRDVARLLRGRAFSAKLAAFDPVAASDLLLPWLQRAARQVVQEPSKGQAGKLVDGFFRELRNRTGMQLMFANISNTLQQFTSFSNAATRVKPGRIAAGLWTYLRDPKGTAEAITALSPFMATRTSGQVFEMRQTIEQLLLNPSKYEKLRDFSQRHAYFMQFALQNVTDLAVWRAAYNQAVERGDDQRDATRFADSVIRETQSSMAPEDVSRFETGTAFTRLFTQFYSYFNNQANLIGTEFQQVARTTGVRKGAGRLLYVYVTAFAVPALLADLIATLMRGGFEDDEEDGYLDEMMLWFFGSQAKFAIAGVPVVGQIANAALGGFTPQVYDDRISTSPAISVVEASANLPSAIYKAIAEGEALSRSDVRDVFTMLGLVTGTPLGAVGRPVSYGYAVAQGDVEPTGPADAVRGLVTGTPSPESRVE